MGLSRAHAGPRIHPPDRAGPLQRRLHDQLEVERVSGNSRAHLRPPVRAGVPARPRRREQRRAAGAGGDLPPEARRRRLQGRRRRPHAEGGAARTASASPASGAGPASLTVARDLAPLGYDVTVFDGEPKAGGMIRTQIPRFRLPEAVIDEEIGYILNLGVALPQRPADRIDEGAAGRRLRRDLRRLAARRAGATSTFPAARRRRSNIHIGIDWLSSVSFGHIKTRSASASSCWAAATPPWTAAARPAASAARTSR